MIGRPQSPGKRFRLDDRLISPGANDVAGSRVEAKAMDVLIALVEAAPAVVSSSELLERVWPNVVVIDNVVHQAIAQLRRALGDDARAPRYIESIPRRGYRVIAQVTPVAGTRVPAAERERASVDDVEPSILVLPFEILSDAVDGSYFAAGVHEDLLVRLARIEGLKVISRTTALALASARESVTQMAAETAVAHVMEGSIRRDGDRVRVTIQLIAALEERHVWAQSYDRRIADIFALQEELAQSIAEQLRIRLDPKVRAGFARAPTKSIEAYDLVMRAVSMNPMNRVELETRIQLLQRAIALDPNYADAYGFLASAEFPIETYGLNWPDVKSRALANIQKALSLDPDNVWGLAAMAYYARRDENSNAAGLKYLAHALRYSPGNPLLHQMVGNRSNDYRERLRHWREAYCLDPLDPKFASTHVVGLLEQNRVDEAFDVSMRAARHAPENAQIVAMLANVLFARGDEVAGLRDMKRAIEANPVDLSTVNAYVLRLTRAGLADVAARWIDAASSAYGESRVRMIRAGWLAVQRRLDDLAEAVTTWPDAARRSAEADLFGALIETGRVNGAGDGDHSSRHVRLANALQAYERLFARFPDVMTPGCLADLRFFPGSAPWTLVNYAAVALRANDRVRATELTGHVARILAEQYPPEAAPLARAVLAALNAEHGRAVREFERAFGPGRWNVSELALAGLLDDADGVFHGIANDPRVKQLVADEVSRRRELAMQIPKEAPDLLEPGEVFARAHASRP